MKTRLLLTTALSLGLGLGIPAGPADAGLSGAYLAARSASFSGDYAAAGEYYAKALARDPGNAMLMEGVVLSWLSLGDVARAAPVARRMQDTGAKSQAAHMVLIAEMAMNGDYDAVLARIDDGLGIGPLVDGLLRAWAQLGQGNMSDALVSFDAVAKERGLRGFALYHKALALASVGDFEGAEAIYSGAAAGAMALTRRGAMARVEVLSQLERPEDALKFLENAFGADLDPGLKTMRSKLQAGETLPFTSITSPRDGMAEVFYSVAGALTDEANDDFTLLYSRVAEYLRPGHIEALLLSAGLLEQMERYELANRTYARVPRDDPAFHAAELGRAEALRRSGKVDAAIAVLEQLAATHGNLPVVQTTLGDILRQQDRFAEAIDAYDRALSLFDKEGANQWFLHYARGIAHERLDHWDAAETDFRKALELNPEQPQVLNYLGYSLVEKNEKLDEALSMIERAVADQPDSGYIIDSLGWVLYRLGRYDEAVGHMERAAELMPVDPVVNDHLGDVYWAVGRQLEARFQWQRAMSFDPEEKDARRIRRKLDVGLDRVLAEEGAAPLVEVANDGR